MTLNHVLVSDKARYPSKEMREIWSDERKFGGWRDVWIANAEAQHKIDPTLVTAEQVDELKKNKFPINYDRANEIERKNRHDVMAHVTAYGEQCPLAAPIIHLGFTSMEPCDNTELIQIKESLDLVLKRQINVAYTLANLATKHAEIYGLARTHIQEAQPTTVGKKCADWLIDQMFNITQTEFARSQIKARGVKGTTGTQDSFMKLFDGDEEKVKNLEELVCKKLGFNETYEITTQTYSRIVDKMVFDALSSIAVTAHKFGLDMRVYQAFRELQEPFEKEQVGSSAMPYKKNPMRSERMCSLARYVIENSGNTDYNAALQIFERTLDDSANRRLILPETFTAVDSILILYQNILDGFIVHDKILKKNLMQALPFLSTEAIMMKAVRNGGNRQEIHEEIRKETLKATDMIYNGEEFNLLQMLSENKVITAYVPPADIKNLMEPKDYVGRAPQMAREYSQKVIAHIEKNYKHLLGVEAKVNV